MSSAMQSKPDKSLAGRSRPAGTPAESTVGHVCTIAPMVAKAQEAFRHELPELIEDAEESLEYLDTERCFGNDVLARSLVRDPGTAFCELTGKGTQRTRSGIRLTDGGTGLTDPPTELSRRQLPRQHYLIMRRLYSARFPSS
jgi:hypothetical protein